MQIACASRPCPRCAQLCFALGAHLYCCAGFTPPVAPPRWASAAGYRSYYRSLYTALRGPLVRWFSLMVAQCRSGSSCYPPRTISGAQNGKQLQHLSEQLRLEIAWASQALGFRRATQPKNARAQSQGHSKPDRHRAQQASQTGTGTASQHTAPPRCRRAAIARSGWPASRCGARCAAAAVPVQRQPATSALRPDHALPRPC